MDKLVSIIIPVYNLENYIENCLNSLVNQTYRNLEFLVIDDGSKDRSGEIIKSMAEKDSRIVYIRQENAGVSAARNNGLDRAKGDYIMFADGDDYMHFQAVEILLECITQKKCGFVFASALNTPKLDEAMKKITDYTCEKSDTAFLFGHIDGNQLGRAIWGKIYSKDCLDGIRFPTDVTHGEDFYFNSAILSKYNPDFFYVNQKLYYYYQRGSSASFVSIKENNLSEIKVIERISNLEYKDSFMPSFSLVALMNIILVYRTKAHGSDIEEKVNKLVRSVWKNNSKRFLSCGQIDIKTKIMTWCFYHSRQLYELARVIKDPTMKDFYKNRKKRS